MSSININYTLLLEEVLEEEFNKLTISSLLSGTNIKSVSAESAYKNIIKNEYKTLLMKKEQDFNISVIKEFEDLKNILILPQTLYFSHNFNYFIASNNGLRQTFFEKNESDSIIYNKRIVIVLNSNGFKELTYNYNSKQKEENLENYIYFKIYNLGLSKILKEYFDNNIISKHIEQFKIIQKIYEKTKITSLDIFHDKKINKELKKKINELPISPFSKKPFEEFEIMKLITDHGTILNFVNGLNKIDKNNGITYD